MMAPKALIAGAARIRTARRAGAPTARPRSVFCHRSPRGDLARRVLRHEQLSRVPPGTRCCRPPLGPPARGLLTGLPGELGRSSRRPACSPSPAEHLRRSETASITIIERL